MNHAYGGEQPVCTADFLRAPYEHEPPVLKPLKREERPVRLKPEQDLPDRLVATC
jgi:hypothetical protein